MAPDNHDDSVKLTNREIQILKLIINGKTNPQIATELNLSPLTIKTHRQSLLRKTHSVNTAQLVANAGLFYLTPVNMA